MSDTFTALNSGSPLPINHPMPISVWMVDGHSYMVDVEDDADDALARVMNHEGEFASGWLTERGGLHLNLAHVVKMRAERPHHQ